MYPGRTDNHIYAIALHHLAYNWIKEHGTLKTTPAVAAGMASRPMAMLDFVTLLERQEKTRGGRLTDYLPAATSK